jgi:hypothetical protein
MTSESSKKWGIKKFLELMKMKTQLIALRMHQKYKISNK